jgi:hypothetical protein
VPVFVIRRFFPLIFAQGLAGLLLWLASAETAAEPASPSAPAAMPSAMARPGESSSGASPAAAAKPGVVTLDLNNGTTRDIEMIQRPDGGFLLPVKTLAALFGIDAQLLEADERLFFADPLTQKRVDIDWRRRTITVNDQPLGAGPYDMVRSRGLLIPDDVYLDQRVFADLLGVTFAFDADATALSMSGERKPRIDSGGVAASDPEREEDSATLIRDPEIYRALIEKIYVQDNSAYSHQRTRQFDENGLRPDANALYALMDTPSVGVRGSIFGRTYVVQPSFIRYNGKANLQRLDWSVEQPMKGGLLSLGSAQSGLSPLTTPTLTMWGLKLASRSALTPLLSPRGDYEFSGRAASGHTVSIQVNNRTLQTVTARDDAYRFDPVFLQAQSMNHVRIVEKDERNQETLLLEKTVPYFQNLLPKGEAGYSAFVGRAPLQFHPLIPDQKTPTLAPQSEKWLAGGRFFYGLGDRLTLGLSGAADRIFGKPDTYFTTLNPLSVDMTGFSSYQRDPNFFNGGNLALSLRYQPTDRWLLSLDGGASRMGVKPGSLLDIPGARTGRAARLRLERQGQALSCFLDTFHYDPDYYTPAVTLYGNTLYDKQGVAAGVHGNVTKILPLGYQFRWDRYRTNLEGLIPGGFINANHWNGSLNTRIRDKTGLSLNVDWMRGDNREREFLQRSVDLSLRTQALPWRLSGEIQARHYFTNTLFLPVPGRQTNLIESPYTNNSLNTNLDIPLGKFERIRLGNQLSTFVNYGFIQVFFQFKRFFFEPLIQKSYGDKPQTQDRFGLRVGYEFKSGARLSVSYYRNASRFGSLSGSAAHSDIRTNQLSFDFSDVFGLLASRLQSLGPDADSQAVLTGRAFADYHADGRKEASEPGVRNVRLVIDKQRNVTTDADGRYLLTGLSTGDHSIEVLPEHLPLTLSTENPVYRVRVGAGKTHRVDIPLLPEGGVLKGRLRLLNIQGEPLDTKGLILVLTSPDGRTVLNYTAVDAQGDYKFGNVPPGRYHIDLEAKLKGSGRYKLLESPQPVELGIPDNYEERHGIGNLNFKLLAL